jgi:hypothetical protein
MNDDRRITMQTNEDTASQSARHLAARAVMAYRAGFPIDGISLSASVAAQSGIVCDWKQLRAQHSNDMKLLQRAFAFIFIGTIIDQELIQPISEDLRKTLDAEISSAFEARETAVEWGLASNVGETNPFAHTGYKLASRVLKTDRAFIDALTNELSARKTMNHDQLRVWLDHNASPIEFDELERSWGF